MIHYILTKGIGPHLFSPLMDKIKQLVMYSGFTNKNHSPTKFIKFSLKLLDYMCFISQKKCKTLDVCLKNQSDD